ncbi:hypothetical protein [Candidatus Nitrotoga sp. HW29]|nr:hypothetical protein [Candidatus Nitrotoga sp. HW29]
MTEQALNPENNAATNELSVLIITLLKGVIYQEGEESLECLA